MSLAFIETNQKTKTTIENNTIKDICKTIKIKEIFLLLNLQQMSEQTQYNSLDSIILQDLETIIVILATS